MSLSYSAQFPYPVPDYHTSNDIYGYRTQALGPYPPLGGAGYGLPLGREGGSLAAPNVLAASDNTVAVQYSVSANRPGQPWQFMDPQVKIIDMNRPPQEFAAYIQQARSPTRLQTSTLGSVSIDNSGYVSYSNMGKYSPSYGRYDRIN